MDKDKPNPRIVNTPNNSNKPHFAVICGLGLRVRVRSLV